MSKIKVTCLASHGNCILNMSNWETAEFETTYSIICLRDCKLQMCFSEPFYHRHVQCGITVPTCELGPWLLHYWKTSSIFFLIVYIMYLFNMQLNSLEHSSYILQVDHTGWRLSQNTLPCLDDISHSCRHLGNGIRVIVHMYPHILADSSLPHHADRLARIGFINLNQQNEYKLIWCQCNMSSTANNPMSFWWS